MVKKLLKVVVPVILAIFVTAVARGQSYESMGAASLRREVEKLLEITKSQREEISLLKKSLETQGNTIAKYQRTTKTQETTIALLRRLLAKPENDVIDNLKHELAYYIRDNQRLVAFCKEVGLDIGPVKEIEKPYPPDVIMYKGKERSEAWAKAMYEKFGDTIIYHDGLFIPIKSAGLVDLSEYKVTQSLGNGQALIAGTYSTRPSSTYHISGLTHKVVDGDSVGAGRFISAETYEYTTVLGAKATVRSLVPVKTLTVEQFRSALASGVELIEYVTTRSRRGNRVTEKPVR